METPQEPAARTTQKGPPPEVLEHGYADIIVLNGRIVTMEDTSPTPHPGRIFQAMAAKKGRIIALGESGSIRELAGPKTTVIDARGRTVIPGIVEPHSHLFDYGATRLAAGMGFQEPVPGINVVLKAARTLDETWKLVEEAIQRALPRAKPDEWLLVSVETNPDVGVTGRILLSWGFAKRFTSRQELDRIAPDVPVLVRLMSFGFGVSGHFNSKGQRKAEEVLPGYWDFAEQAFHRDAANQAWVGFGELTGLRWEAWYSQKPLSLIAEMFRLESEAWASYGITTFATRVPMPTILSAYTLLNRQKQMPIRLAAHYEVHRMPGPPQALLTLYRRTGLLTDLGSDYMWLTGIASELWDLHGAGACLGPDVEAPPEIKRRERTPTPGDFYWTILKEALKAGWRLVGVHGVGSHGARLFTQMVEEGMREKGLTAEEIRARRPTLEHCTVIGKMPDVVEKLKEYGVILGFSSVFLEDTQTYLNDYGPEIEPFILPVKSLLEAGVKVVGNIDCDGPHKFGAFHYMWLLIERRVRDQVFVPEERLDRGIVLKMWTRWAADYVAREGDLGSLEVGKLADFVVLDRDYFTIPEDDIRRIRPLMTVVGGKVVSLKEDFARELGTAPVGFQPPADWPQAAW